MPLFKVVERYPQAQVDRVMFVKADSLKEAKEDPHSGLVHDCGYVVEEGGEACTVSAKPVSQYQLKKALRQLGLSQ